MRVESIETIPQPQALSQTQKGSATAKPETRWRTPTQQRIYGQRLLQALKSTRKASSQPLVPPRAIRDAADSALALTAKGQTRWSRAILSRGWQNRKFTVKARGKIRRRPSPRKRIGISGLASDSGLLTPPPQCPEEGEKVTQRLRALAQLVPGARKLSTTTLLEETVDYVAALEVEVNALRTLVDLLTSASVSTDAERTE